MDPGVWPGVAMANSVTLPAYTRVDLGAYYAVTDALQLDLLLNNVTDEEIFSPGSFDGVIREEGRTYLARVKNPNPEIVEG